MRAENELANIKPKQLAALDFSLSQAGSSGIWRLLVVKFFQLDIVQSNLVEGVFHGVLYVIERDQDKSMNFAQGINYPWLTAIQVINQRGYKHEREYVDEDEAISPEADRSAMHLQPNCVLDTLVHVFQESNDLE